MAVRCRPGTPDSCRPRNKKPRSRIGGAPLGFALHRIRDTREDQLRRSACQVPEQAPLPPLQDPPPVRAARRPVPVAVRSPVLTLTTTEPLLPTRPVIRTDALLPA